MLNFDENTEVFESAILNYIVKVDSDYELHDQDNSVIDRFKVISNISGAFFENPIKEKVFNAIKSYSSVYGKIPTTDEIFSVLRSKNDEMEEEDLMAMFSLNLQRYKPDFLYSYMKTFILRGNLDKTVNQIIAELRTKKITPENIEETIDDVKNKINEELNIDLIGKKRGFDIMDPISHIQQVKHNSSTGFPYFDKVMGGGWEPGTLIVFEGPPKAGKSMVLGNIGVRAFFNKLNVGIFTVELSAAKYMKRLGSNAFNVPYVEYKNYTDEKTVQVLQSVIDQTKESFELGHLIVDEGPTGATTSLDIENYFQAKEKELGMKFDLVIIDYINLLKYYKGDTSLYEKIKGISEELRKIAKRNNWCIITATQVKVAYFNADDLFLDSTAESSGLVATVDSLFGLISNATDRRIKIKNIANRDEGHMGSFKYFRKEQKYFRIVEDWAQDSEFWPDEDVDLLENAMADEYKNLNLANTALSGYDTIKRDSSISEIIKDSFKRVDESQKNKLNFAKAAMPKIGEAQQKMPIPTDEQLIFAAPQVTLNAGVNVDYNSILEKVN